MQAIGIIISEYFKVINKNEQLSLRDFIIIYKRSLIDLESRMCVRYNYRNNHTCFICKNEVFSIMDYLSNFTQTLFSVIDFLGRITPIESEKIIFENILSNIASFSSRFIFFNLFFQYKIISERVQEFLNDFKIIPKKLSLFLQMCRGSFNFLDVSLDITLNEFFKVSSSEIQWNFFALSSNNKNRDKKINIEFGKYWNKIFGIYDYFDFSSDLETSDSDKSINIDLDLDDYQDNKDYFDLNEDELFELINVLFLYLPLNANTSMSDFFLFQFNLFLIDN